MQNLKKKKKEKKKSSYGAIFSNNKNPSSAQRTVNLLEALTLPPVKDAYLGKDSD